MNPAIQRLAAKIGMMFPHLDDVKTMFFANQVVSIRNTIYRQEYPELLARTFIPVVPGAYSKNTSVIISRAYDRVGYAKLISSYADDLPRVDQFGYEVTARARPLGDAYGWDIFEVETAQEEGRNLPAEKAGIAREGVENLIDKLLLSGDTSYGLVGLANQPNALTYVLPNGAGGTQKWLGANMKTNAEILADLVKIAGYSKKQSYGRLVPDTMLLPPTPWEIVSTTRFSDSSDLTILEYFQKVNKNITTIAEWTSLQGIGASGKDRIICYKRDPLFVEGIIPREFEQLDPQARNLESVVNCHARCGGVIAHRPLSIVYADGASVGGA